MRLSLICEDVGKTALARKAISAAVEKGQLAPHSEADLLRAVEALINSDPTPGKTYLMWLVKMYINGHISLDGLPPRPVGLPPTNPMALPANQAKIIQTLNLFLEATPRLEPNDRNIFAFPDFDALTSMLDTYVQSGRIKAKASVRKMPGTRIIYNKNGVVVYAIGRISFNLDTINQLASVWRQRALKLGNTGGAELKPTAQALYQVISADVDQTSYNYATTRGITIENLFGLTELNYHTRKLAKRELERDVTSVKAMGALGMGPPETKWCTRSGYTNGGLAATYSARGDNFIIYKNGEPLLQQTYSGGKNTESKDVADINTPLSTVLPELASEIESVIMAAHSTLINIFNTRLAAAIESAKAQDVDPLISVFAKKAEILAYMNSASAIGKSGKTPKEMIESLRPNRPFIISGRGDVITLSNYEIVDTGKDRPPYGSDEFKPFVRIYTPVSADGYRLGKNIYYETSGPKSYYQKCITMNLENLVIYDSKTGKFDKPEYPGSHRHICMVKLPSGEITSMDG